MSWIKAYKGFTKDMKCHDYQYAEGETYELPEGQEAKLCESGFHACEAPIDCLSYYAPDNSVYREVELDATDEKSNDSKRVGRCIKIGTKLSIKGLVKAQIEFVKKHVVNNGDGHSTGNWSANSATGNRSANSATGYGSANSATGDRSANSATGNRSANSATGYGSANSATGNRSANSATGYRSANSATGNRSANSATGYGSANSATSDWSANSATGYGSANSATGYWSANSATGYGSANVSTGNCCSNSGGAGTISVGWGRSNKCKGDIGAYLVLCERGKWDGNKYPLIGEPVLLKIDGKQYKPDTWYMLKGGKIVEAGDSE